MTSKSLSFLAAATVLSVLLVSTSSLPLDAKPAGVLSRSVRGACRLQPGYTHTRLAAATDRAAGFLCSVV